MPIKQAAKKYLRQTKKRRAYNLLWKRKVKEAVKKTRKLIAEKKKDEAKKAYLEAVKIIDKAVQKGVLKKNSGSRKKSRLALALNKIK